LIAVRENAIKGKEMGGSRERGKEECTSTLGEKKGKKREEHVNEQIYWDEKKTGDIISCQRKGISKGGGGTTVNGTRAF